MDEQDPERLQFGHDDSAGSPIWFIGGLLAVEDLGLRADLAASMVAWADEVDEYCTLPDHVWVGSDQNEFESRGDGLAAQLAEELGDGFVVERSTGPFPRHVFRGSSAPTNPDAAARVGLAFDEQP